MSSPYLFSESARKGLRSYFNSIIDSPYILYNSTKFSIKEKYSCVDSQCFFMLGGEWQRGEIK